MALVEVSPSSQSDSRVSALIEYIVSPRFSRFVSDSPLRVKYRVINQVVFDIYSCEILRFKMNIVSASLKIAVTTL